LNKNGSKYELWAKNIIAEVVELVDTLDSKSSMGETM
jgi:hypothetical protein